MAGTVTPIEKNAGAIDRIEFDWTSSAAGAADGATVLDTYIGVIKRVVFIPGAATPTTGYAVTILDDDGADLLLGNGASVSSSVTVQVTGQVSGGLGCVARSHLTLHVTGAGNAKNGTVIVYIGGSS